MGLLAQPTWLFRMQGFLVATILLAGLAWAVLPSFRRQRTSGEDTVGAFADAISKLLGQPKGKKVREYKGKHWTASGHDLDRIFERDGIAYGVEVKNTLKYIESSELATKLQMCQSLGVRPLFIMRASSQAFIDRTATRTS